MKIMYIPFMENSMIDSFRASESTVLSKISTLTDLGKTAKELKKELKDVGKELANFQNTL